MRDMTIYEIEYILINGTEEEKSEVCVLLLSTMTMIDGMNELFSLTI